jgi:hypothetical protein
MSLWFKAVVFKLKKGIPAIILKCLFVFYNQLERETRFSRIEVLDVQSELVDGQYEKISWFGVCN